MPLDFFGTRKKSIHKARKIAMAIVFLVTCGGIVYAIVELRSSGGQVDVV